MKKLEVIKAVAATAETTQKAVEAVLDAYAAVVLDAIKEDVNETVPLPGIGTFKGKEVAEKSGTITLGSKAGETWTKPAHNELVFKVSTAVKEF